MGQEKKMPSDERKLTSVKVLFDEEKHIYYGEDGTIYPSVTKIIKTEEHFSNIPKDRQRQIMDKGTILHQDIDYFISTGDTAGNSVLEGFADIYQQLLNYYGEFICGEVPLGASYDDMVYAGKPDIVLENAVVEIKSSLSAIRVYTMQLEGYAMLVEANFNITPKERVICYRKNNEWEIYVTAEGFGGVKAREAFIAMLKKYYLNQIVNTYNTALL